MAKQKFAPLPTATRMWSLAGLVLMIAAVSFVVWNLSGSQTGFSSPSGRDKEAVTKTKPDSASLGNLASSGARNTRSTLNRNGGSSGEVTQFPLVQRILSDQSLSESQAAKELAGIVRRTDISQEERFEALAHGLNLDFKSLSDVANDVSLPVPMAQRYLDELANRNHLPKEQINGCLGLMNHSDEDIRKQAAIELAFLVENESLATSPDQLRKAVADRLEILQTNPPVQEQATTDDSVEISGLK